LIYKLALSSLITYKPALVQLKTSAGFWMQKYNPAVFDPRVRPLSQPGLESCPEI